MLARIRRVTCMIAAAATLLLGLPGTVAATIGPYTFPFYRPHTMTQDYGPTSVTAEPAGHGYTHWHNGIDWSMSIGTDIAASNAGTVGNIKEDLYDGQGPDPLGQGNYVFVSHGGSRWSLYYHLTHNGVIVSTNDDVSAGQHIADSGNTGASSGPHLHYSLMTTSTCQSNSCDTDPRLWTTSPGRVPFEATYSSESNGGTEHVEEGHTIVHWVKFKNTGGRTWSTSNDSLGHGRIVLYSTTSSGTASSPSGFQASDWESSTLVTQADQSSVAPDGIGTFTFGIYGGHGPGSYTNYFNLRAYALAWFDYDTIGDYYIPIVVDINCDLGC